MRISTGFVLGLVFTSLADAGTITVDKKGAITTIQAGIDAASAGDTLVVKPGIYHEPNLTIDNAKTGLIVKAVGKVQLDATPAMGQATSQGFIVSADDVKISGFTVYGAKDVNHQGVAGMAFDLIANGVTIDHCQVKGCDFCGVFGIVTGCTVSNSRFTATARPVLLTGIDHTVTRCTMDGCYGNTIEINGDNADISKCQITNSSPYFDLSDSTTHGTAIQITGSGSSVAQCTIDSARGGIDIVGGSATVTKNKVHHVAEIGIRVDAATCGIGSNEVRWTTNCDAIYVRNGTTVGVTFNKVSNFAFDGVYIAPSCTFGSIGKNTVDHGASWSNGIECNGVNFNIFDNKVAHCRDGIQINNNGCTVDSNIVLDNSCDGIDNAADNVTIKDNKCQRNLGEGIDNSGAGIVMTGNVATKNRIDIANSGTIGTFSGNTFKTGGTTTPPESD